MRAGRASLTWDGRRTGGALHLGSATGSRVRLAHPLFHRLQITLVASSARNICFHLQPGSLLSFATLARDVFCQKDLDAFQVPSSTGPNMPTPCILLLALHPFMQLPRMLRITISTQSACSPHCCKSRDETSCSKNGR